jgi:hypothetical protein
MGNVQGLATGALVRSEVGGVPVLYAWDVFAPDEARGDQGACGVTRDPVHAVAEVRGSLRGLPQGAWGTVRKVTTSLSGEVRYLDLGVVGGARRTRRGVSWVACDPALLPSLVVVCGVVSVSMVGAVLLTGRRRRYAGRHRY